MRLCKVGVGVTCAIMLMAVASPALAGEQPLLSFSFSDLAGEFTVDTGGLSGLFTAANDEASNGDVTLVASDETAEFANGVAFPGLSAFQLTLPVAGASTVSAVTTGGTLALVDINGDSFVAGVDGMWGSLEASGIIVGAGFVGSLSDIQVNMSNDGFFEGAASTGFPMQGLPSQGLEGTVVGLTVPGWFVDSAGQMQPFEGTNVGSIGAIVPEPLTLSLLALGGLALVGRGKKRA